MERKKIRSKSISKGISRFFGKRRSENDPNEFIIGPPQQFEKVNTMKKKDCGKIEGFEDVVEMFKTELAGDDVADDARQNLIENAITFANQNDMGAIRYINHYIFTNIKFNISERGSVAEKPDAFRNALTTEN